MIKTQLKAYKVTHKDLANYLGVSRPTLDKHIMYFDKERIIPNDPKTTEILRELFPSDPLNVVDFRSIIYGGLEEAIKNLCLKEYIVVDIHKGRIVSSFDSEKECISLLEKLTVNGDYAITKIISKHRVQTVTTVDNID